MKRHIAIYHLSPSNIEVLGHRVKETDASWIGLDWPRASLRDRNDKLSIPWWHPEDPKEPDFQCIYSVYPQAMAGKRWHRRMVLDAWFERNGQQWFVAVEYDKPLPRKRTVAIPPDMG